MKPQLKEFPRGALHIFPSPPSTDLSSPCYESVSNVSCYGGFVDKVISYLPFLSKKSVNVSCSDGLLIKSYPIYPFLVENILKPLDLTDDRYKKVMELMKQNIEEGLHPDTHAKANIKCFPTYVRTVPDGTENGNFLALDLGGTNFRVLLINLDGQQVAMERQTFNIPQHIMLGSGDQLFDHIADCIFKFMCDHHLHEKQLPLGFTFSFPCRQFMCDHHLHEKQLPLGFTFSFPCRQVGLDRAILTTWTKGFKCEGVEGRDIVELLHAAIQRRGDMKNVRCLAVINDTVGALMSCAHSDRNCAVGLILGE
ncbi:phosphotransferase [Elysia marginata]|uniref:Phosphotransferase n=1 Tax=Elysia marginata TaxID=1093978 RepID=A0AAV4JVH2_9GAST|nr:phosphotransferase [Elysia marginata]